MVYKYLILNVGYIPEILKFKLPLACATAIAMATRGKLTVKK
jgi:hypothetical protein